MNEGDNLSQQLDQDTPMAEDSSNHANADSSQNQQQNVKKRKIRTIDLNLTAKVPQLSKSEINSLYEQELAMIQQDKKEKERSEAKNAVEEYIYEMRDKLSNDYERFIIEEVKF